MQNYKFQIDPLNLEKAGEVSSFLKKYLININLNKTLIKKICIATYEAEINVVIHSYGGHCIIDISNGVLKISFIDKGPGIENICWAMQKGNSTANEYAINNGFGAGMGLPNIKANCDDFQINSSPLGTSLVLTYFLE